MKVLKAMMLMMTSLTFPSFLYAQSWKNLVLNDEVSVDFPSLPVRREANASEAYFYRMSDCAFMVTITKKEFKEYWSNLKLDKNHRFEAAEVFLNEIVIGKMAHGNQKLLSSKTLKINGCLGKEIAYLTDDNKDSNTRKRFSILLLIKDNLYTFDCWYLQQEVEPKNKDQFFKSILVKD